MNLSTTMESVHDEWQMIFDTTDTRHQYMSNTMLLALVTGQRLADISNTKFSDIGDGPLHVVKDKTRSKLAISLP